MKFLLLLSLIGFAAALTESDLNAIFGRNELPANGTNGFSWSLCSDAGAYATINSLNVAPDPIMISKTNPTEIDFSVNAALNAAFDNGSVQLKLYKKVLGVWTLIPCISGVGSCTYDNACSLLPTGDCPPVFAQYGIPCHCPLGAFSVNVPTTAVSVHQQKSIPSWLASGEYKATANVHDSTGKDVICVNVEASLKLE